MMTIVVAGTLNEPPGRFKGFKSFEQNIISRPTSSLTMYSICRLARHPLRHSPLEEYNVHNILANKDGSKVRYYLYNIILYYIIPICTVNTLKL